MTQLQFRWLILICFGLVGLLGIAWPRLPYQIESTWICPVSGQFIRETAKGFPKRTVRVVESDGLLPWVRGRNPEFEPQLTLLCRREFLLFKVTRTCYPSPPIASLKAILPELPDTIAQAELWAMVRVLESGSAAEQDRIVQRIKTEYETATGGADPEIRKGTP